MGTTKKSNKRIDEGTRERLLKVGARLFASQGFAKTTVREIARAGKCNLSLVSYYFDGKDRFYRSIFEAFFARVYERISKAHVEAGTDKQEFSREAFIQSTRNKMRLMLEEFDTEPEIKKLMLRELVDGLKVARGFFEEQTKDLIASVTAEFETAKKLGYVKSTINANFFCILLNRAIEGYVFAYDSCPSMMDTGLDPFKKREAFLDQIEEIFLRGILK